MFSEDVEEEPVIESLAQLSKGALSDLAGVFAAMQEDALDALIEEIVKAKRIVVFGLGREGCRCAASPCGSFTWAATSPSGAT
jgi:DNA-binding MurR/RpiR family transcriptional regulator